MKRYTSLPFDLNIGSASRKLLAGFPEDTKMMISRLESVLTFWSPSRTAGSPYLKDVIEAALHQRVIRIGYRSKSGTSDREVLPIGVYAQDGLWYMPAVEHGKEGVRLFRMDRMESLALTDNSYEADISMQEWLEEYPIREPVRLYAELTREGARQCESIPWLENEVAMQDEHRGIVDTTIDGNDLEYVAQIFLRLGMEARVIEPPEIVDMLREKARQLSLHYGLPG